MIYKMTSKEWVRGPMDRFSSIVRSAPTARIELKCLSTGRMRTEWINVDCLADEQFRRGYEDLSAEEGFVIPRPLAGACASSAGKGGRRGSLFAI